MNTGSPDAPVQMAVKYRPAYVECMVENATQIYVSIVRRK